MTVAETYAAALRHHQAGRLNEAEQLYRQILAADPRHADSLHLLGVIASQKGGHDQAADLIRDAIAVSPDTASYHFNLGNVLRSQGKLDEAIACYRRALELQPAFPEAHTSLAAAHNNLGVILKEQDRPGEAAACYRRAIDIKPNFAEAHYNLGIALQALEIVDEAADCYRKAIALKPDWPMAHNNLGNALKKQGRLDEAVVRYRQAIALEPGYAEAHNNLGTALKDQGQAEEAVACFHRAIALRPGLAEAHNNLGAALKDQGRFEEAIAAHQKALLSGPDATAYYELSGCRKFTRADQPLIADMTALLENPRLCDRNRSLLHFGLGKIFDDLAEYQTAIGHFDEANKLGRGNTRFDGPGFAAMVDWLIETFPEGALRACAASDSQLPVLIVGMPRSGTTLAEQILASHPQVAAGGELNFWLQRSDWVGKRRIGQLDAAAEKSVIHDYLGLLTGISPDAMRVTDKMPYNFLFLGLIHRLFPRARIIHCRRNAIDTALSLYFNRFTRMPEFTYRRNDIIFYYRQYERLMQHWRAVLPAGQFLEVDYEKLVAGLEPVSRQMVAFCGLEWNSACLDFYRTARPVATASAWQVRQPLYHSSVERWRRYEPWLGEFRTLLP